MLDVAPEQRVVHDVAAARRSRSPLDLFDLLPQALVVCDHRGRVVESNASFRQIVAPGGATDRRMAMSCCTLFGCGRADGPLADGCLTAVALDGGESVCELRLQLPFAPPGPYLVTGAPLHGDPSYVVFELRPAGRPASAVPRLRIRTLGGLRVDGPEPLSGEWLEQRPGQLLRLLVCERHRVVPADAIAEALLPHAGHAAVSNVRYLVHTLRARLEPSRARRSASSFVVSHRGGYTLHRQQVWIDADDFERRVGEGMAALAAGDRSRAAERLRRAVALYDGDFLADEPYAEWALAERDRLHAVAGRALRTLADLHAADPAAAIGYLERLAAIEPLDDDVERDLLSTWLRLGRKSRAARHYQAYRLRLMREFGERPAFELSHLSAAVPSAPGRS
jgi:DNA-binding SARP family transcriptional activator